MTLILPLMRTTAPLLILWMIVQGGCSDLFNTKDNTDTDEIFDEGKIDPRLENVDGYAPVLPFWEDLKLLMTYM